MALMFTSLAMAVALAVVVERAKKSLDFSFTVYFLHVAICSIFGAFPVNATWWLTHVVAFILSSALGEWLCLKKEMQEISVDDILGRGGDSNAGGRRVGRGGRAAKRRSGHNSGDIPVDQLAPASASGAGARPVDSVAIPISNGAGSSTAAQPRVGRPADGSGDWSVAPSGSGAARQSFTTSITNSIASNVSASLDTTAIASSSRGIFSSQSSASAAQSGGSSSSNASSAAAQLVHSFTSALHPKQASAAASMHMQYAPVPVVDPDDLGADRSMGGHRAGSGFTSRRTNAARDGSIGALPGSVTFSTPRKLTRDRGHSSSDSLAASYGNGGMRSGVSSPVDVGNVVTFTSESFPQSQSSYLPNRGTHHNQPIDGGRAPAVSDFSPLNSNLSTSAAFFPLHRPLAPIARDHSAGSMTGVDVAAPISELSTGTPSSSADTIAPLDVVTAAISSAQPGQRLVARRPAGAGGGTGNAQPSPVLQSGGSGRDTVGMQSLPGPASSGPGGNGAGSDASGYAFTTPRGKSKAFARAPGGGSGIMGQAMNLFGGFASFVGGAASSGSGTAAGGCGGAGGAHEGPAQPGGGGP